jgi:hypothetical protein
MFTSHASTVGRLVGSVALAAVVSNLCVPALAAAQATPGGAGSNDSVGVFAVVSPLADNSADAPQRVEQAAVDSPSAGNATLRLAYFDGSGMSPEVRQAMQEEVERVFGEVGVSVLSLGPENMAEVMSVPGTFVLQVMVMAKAPSGWDLPPHALGVYFNGQTYPPQAVYAFKPSIYKELELDTRGESYLRPEEIGRAFGRVVAHEVVHALAPDHKHSGWGILGHAQDERSLLQPQLSIHESAGDALRAGLAEIGQYLVAALEVASQ